MRVLSLLSFSHYWSIVVACPRVFVLRYVFPGRKLSLLRYRVADGEEMCPREFELSSSGTTIALTHPSHP